MNAEVPMTYARKPARPNPAQLVQAHMPLVRKIAWHVHGRVSNAMDVEDLVQIGMVALVEAANGYEDRGHAFSTYAGMRVRGAMIDHLRRHATQARSGMVKRKELARARVELESRLGRAATEAELCSMSSATTAGLASSPAGDVAAGRVPGTSTCTGAMKSCSASPKE